MAPQAPYNMPSWNPSHQMHQNTYERYGGGYGNQAGGHPAATATGASMGYGGYPTATSTGSPMNYGGYYPPGTYSAPPGYNATAGTAYRGGYQGASSYANPQSYTTTAAPPPYSPYNLSAGNGYSAPGGDYNSYRGAGYTSGTTPNSSFGNGTNGASTNNSGPFQVDPALVALIDNVNLNAN